MKNLQGNTGQFRTIPDKKALLFLAPRRFFMEPNVTVMGQRLCQGIFGGSKIIHAYENLQK